MFHLVNLVPRLFLESLFLDAKQDEKHVSWFKTRHLAGRLNEYEEEIDDLYGEVADLKEGKGYMSIKEHKRELEDHKRQVKALQRENDRLEQKLRERDAFYQEKLKCQSKRHEKAEAGLYDALDKMASKQSDPDSDDDIIG